MKILMINKFLYPKGGAETYMLQLGAQLTARGHRVEYFGMAHPANTVGNTWGLYTATMDFHGGRLLAKASYPLRIIHSREAQRKMAQLLEKFRPDVVHLNNFNFQLTPSILLAAQKYRSTANPKLRIVCTAHDSQLVCPNHLMFRPDPPQVCEDCLKGNALPCIRNRCIHGSLPRSILGAVEYHYWRSRNVYDTLDLILCPSAFMKSRLDTDPVLAPKTSVLRNFVAPKPPTDSHKEHYVLYFGRYSEEKGIRPLLNVCRALPHIPFVFAGGGPLESLIERIPNVRNAGFLGGEDLHRLIRQARFSICPSQCHDNCPFSVMESIMAGTPVLGSDLGGIPGLIDSGRTGWLFPAHDEEALRAEIARIWESDEPERFRDACLEVHFDSLEEYTQKLESYYREGGTQHG